MHFLSLTITKLEEKLADYVGRKYCLLVGRATTALFLALKSFNFKNGNVVVPSIVCPNPIFSILYSNLTPNFCDINLDDYTIDIDSFKETIDENTRAVIPINLYGYPANYDSLISICNKYKIKIIEDAAQSLGGSYNERKMGSIGDVSVISFGHTKIIDIGSGGAILTDNKELMNQIKINYESLKEKPLDLKEKSEIYRKVYYTLQPLWQSNDSLYYLYSAFPDLFKSMYLFKFSEDLIRPLDLNLNLLDQIVNFRKKNAEKYIELLKDHSEILLPKYNKKNGVYWRFSFLIKGAGQLKITEKLRNKGFDVSNWYPSTHKMFIPPNSIDTFKFKNSDKLEKHIINFWVDPKIKESDIENICNSFLDFLN